MVTVDYQVCQTYHAAFLLGSADAYLLICAGNVMYGSVQADLGKKGPAAFLGL